MNLLHNILVHQFLDDVVDVGLAKWALWSVLLGFLAWLSTGVGIVPLIGVSGLLWIFTANLLFAFVVGLWWDKRGREKYATTSILDIADQMEFRGQ